MFITLYYIVTRLPDSLRSVRDHFLTLDPTSLTIDLLEQHLLAAETSAVAVVRSAATARARVAGVVQEAAVVVEVAVGVAVGAAVEEVEAMEVVAAVGPVAEVEALVAAVEAAEGVAAVEAVGPVVVGLDLSVEALVAVGASSSSGSETCPYVIRTGARAGKTCGRFHTERRCFARLDDAWRTEFGDDVERPRWAELLRSGGAIFDLDFDVIISAMYALSFNAESDCYWCVPPDPGIVAAALGASAPGTPPGTAPGEALHTFTLDSGASRCFFRDSTTLTPLSAPVPVRLADPSGGPVVASSSTILPCPAVPSGSLSGLHLPLFSTNLVSTDALHDAMVTTTTPGGQRVSICTCTRTGRHLATFTRRPGSSLYTLATEHPQIAASAQVSASGQIAASCSCRLLSHQTLLWHHRPGHPSLPRLCGMHSRLLVSGLPRSLPPLPPSPAPPCLPCVKGRQCAAPHSSSFPPTTAPLQTLHMDVWGPARVSGQGRELYFLLVVDDYTRYTTVFLLRSKGEVFAVLIPWIRTVRLQLRERFGQDLAVLRLHSDRGGEFSSDLLREFCGGEGITQSFTLPDSPQQNGIAERRIGLVMEVARTSMIHAAAPHFLWPFAVRYAVHHLNLWPRVSLPETSPTLRWTGKVGDASVFRVWGSRAFVRYTSADKLSARAIPCVFLGFVLDAPGWQFYHPTSRRVLPSQDVTFDESVPFYRLFPYRSAPSPPPPLFLAPGPPPVDPLPPQGPAPSGVSQVDPLPGTAPVQVAVISGAAPGAASGGATSGGAAFGGAEPGGAGSGGAGSGGAEPEGVEPGGAESEGAEPEGAESKGAESGGAEPRGAALSGVPAGASPRLSLQQLREWLVQRAHRRSVAPGAGEPGDAGAGGAAVPTGAGDPTEPGAAGTGGAGAGVAGVGGPGAGGAGGAGAGAVDPGAGGTVRPRPYFVPLLQQVLGVPSFTGLPPPFLCPPPDQSQPPLQPASPLHVPSPYTEQSGGLTERREPASRPVSPVRTAHCAPRPRPPSVPGTHTMALRPSSVPLRVPLLAPPESSLPAIPDRESDRARAASPTVARLLATAVTDPSFESAAASALVAELLDFAAACRLDYASTLVADVKHHICCACLGYSGLAYKGRAACTGPSRPTCLSAAPTVFFPPTTTIPLTAPMASPPVLAFDAEGRPVKFETWLDNLHLFLQLTAKDDISLYDHALGHTTAPAATADSTARSQWQTRDAHARFAIRNSLPIDEREHFGQHKTAQALYTAVVARYSSPASAALGRLSLPYLFPDLASFHTVADLITHLRTIVGVVLPAPLPPPPLFLAPGAAVVDPLPPQGAAPSGVSQVDPVEPVEVAIDSRPAAGAEPGGAESGGAVPGGAEPGGAEPGGAESGGAVPGSAEPGGAESGGPESGGPVPESPTPGGALSSEQLRVWYLQYCSLRRGTSGAWRTTGVGAGASPPRRELPSRDQIRAWYERRCTLRSGAPGVTDPGATGTATGAVESGVGAAVGAGDLGVGAAAGAEDPGVGAATGAEDPGAGAAAGAVESTVGAAAGVGDPGVGAATGAEDPGVGAAAGAEDPGTGESVGSGVAARQRPYFVPLLQQVLGLPSSTGPPPPLECPQPVPSQLPLHPASPLPAPSPYTGPTGGLAERREPASRPASPVRAARTSGRGSRQRPPPVPGTHRMSLRPSTAPLRAPLPSPPESSLHALSDPESDFLRAASPTVARLLATVVTDPSFESTAASALVAELVDFAACCRLDYAASLVAESESVCPPSVGGECALSTDVLEDRQEEFQCLAAASPHLVSVLLTPGGDPNALDIPTPRSYAEAIEGPYSSQWQAAMDAEMASWKSTGTYVDVVPPPGANIVSGMWIFRGVDYFQTFSPTLKMTTLRVLLHVAAHRDYELHSLDFSTAFLQGSLHEEIWLRRPPGFTGTSPPGTQWSLRRPSESVLASPPSVGAAVPRFASLLLAPEGDPDAPDIPTPRSYAEAITGPYSSQWQAAMDAEMASWKSTGSYVDEVPPPGVNIVDGMWIFRVKRPPGSPPAFKAHYVARVYIDDLVFAMADTEALTLVKSELQKRHTCTDLGELRSYLGLQITRDRAQRTITQTQSHMVHQVLQHFGFQFSSPQLTPLSTSHSLSAPPSDESVEPSGPYPELVGCLMYLMTCTRPDLAYPLSLLACYVAPVRRAWGLCLEDGALLSSGTQRSSQGYTFGLGSSSVPWRSICSSSVLSSSCEAEIYAGAMAAQELRWLTYLLTELGEQSRSRPVLYVDNKAMIALCQEHRLEHRTKHIALRYFLAR
ncbi:unnamed protein product [Closterium sp. NIES-53]